MQDFVLFIQHHWALSSALAIILILLIIVEFIKLRRGTKSLSPAQVTELINHNDAIIVDIRSFDAFAAGHIVGSMSIPLSELKDKYKKLEKFTTQPIVIVCAAGLDTPKATALLTERALNLYTLNGGIRAWQTAGMPLVKE